MWTPCWGRCSFHGLPNLIPLNLCTPTNSNNPGNSAATYNSSHWPAACVLTADCTDANTLRILLVLYCEQISMRTWVVGELSSRQSRHCMMGKSYFQTFQKAEDPEKQWMTLPWPFSELHSWAGNEATFLTSRQNSQANETLVPFTPPKKDSIGNPSEILSPF